MNCSICYEKFINPEDFEPEEFRKMIKESNWTNGVWDYKKSITFQNLTAKPIKCNTNNCDAIFCLGCYYKIKRSAMWIEKAERGVIPDSARIDGISMPVEEAEEYGFDFNDIFKCPYCRNNNYKDYLSSNVFPQMLGKIYGIPGLRKWELGCYDLHNK